MDPATLSQLVSTLGFPIVVCGVLFYILKLFLTKLLSNLEQITTTNEELVKSNAKLVESVNDKLDNIYDKIDDINSKIYTTNDENDIYVK